MCDGDLVGSRDGLGVNLIGAIVGFLLGLCVGALVGARVGTRDGACVGLVVVVAGRDEVSRVTVMC